MPKQVPIVSKIFNLIVLLLLEIAAILMVSNNGTLQKLWVARISHGFMAKVWGTTTSVNNYFSLKKQNDVLAIENTMLWDKLEAQNEILSSLDSSNRSVVKDNGFKYTPAVIVKASSNSQHNYIIINKGSDDGIVENSGIITANGVVGLIDAVSKHYSFAISFLNTEMNISARLGNEGAVGPLAWDGKSTDGAILREIPLQFKFEPGDTVYTSGYSAIFPPDIPLGVTGEAKIINGSTNEIKVKLFQNMNALRYVTIIENTKLKEIQTIEEQANKPKK